MKAPILQLQEAVSNSIRPYGPFQRAQLQSSNPTIYTAGQAAGRPSSVELWLERGGFLIPALGYQVFPFFCAPGTQLSPPQLGNRRHPPSVSLSKPSSTEKLASSKHQVISCFQDLRVSL